MNLGRGSSITKVRAVRIALNTVSGGHINLIRIVLAGATLRNSIVFKRQNQSLSVRVIRGTSLQDLVILCAAKAQNAAGLAAEGQLAVLTFIGAVGTVGVGEAATSGEHAGAGNGNCCNSRVLHKITTGECIRHNNFSFE